MDMMFHLSKNTLGPGHQGVFKLPAVSLLCAESKGIQNEGHERLEGS